MEGCICLSVDNEGVFQKKVKSTEKKKVQMWGAIKCLVGNKQADFFFPPGDSYS